MIALMVGALVAGLAASVPVRAPSLERSRYLIIPVSGVLDAGPFGDYRGLRVVDDTGREIPYALDPLPPAPAPFAPLSIVKRRSLPKNGSEVTVEAGARSVNTLALQLSASPSFLARAIVSSSDDGSRWTALRDDALLYRSVSSERTELQIPRTRARYLRIALIGGSETISIDSVLGTERDVQSGDNLIALGAPERDPTSEGQRWTLDFGDSHVPASALVLRGAAGTFERHVTVETSDDGVEWASVANEPVYRFGDGSERLAFSFGEQSARRWRITLVNGDNGPLTVQPVLLGRLHRIVFLAHPGRHYALVTSPDERQAEYDLAERLTHEHWNALAATVDTSAERRVTPNGDATQPSLQRTPPFPFDRVVTAAFLGVAVLLGAFAGVLLLRSGTGPDAESEPERK